MDYLIISVIVSLILCVFISFRCVIKAQKSSACSKPSTEYTSIHNMIEAIPSAVILTDKLGCIQHTNNAAVTLLGYNKEILRTMTVEHLIPPGIRKHHVGLRKKYEEDKSPPRYMSENARVVALTSSGIELPIEISLGKIRSSGTEYTMAVLVDITQRLVHEESIRKLAYSDPLTGLPNRLFVTEKAKQLYLNSTNKNQPFAVFLIDVDHFKNVNDTYGHATGDYVLKRVAVLLGQVLLGREGFAARLSGDEFVIVFHDCNPDHIIQLANDLYKTFETPIPINDQDFYINITTGIGVSPEGGASLSRVLHMADTALYEAKKDGRNRYKIHTPDMTEKMLEKSSTEEALRYFINTGDFEIKYQPIIDTASNTVSTAEALFRGNEKFPSLSLVGLFTLAEELGLMSYFGEVISKKVVDDIKPLIHKHPDFVIAINVSFSELDQDSYVKTIHTITNEAGIPPDNIMLELTESVLVTNFIASSFKMKTLQRIGFKQAIDDFGMGYSSMSYLNRLPVDKIKIDKEFIDFIEDDKTYEIVKGITTIAHGLGLQVCAEGVETESQLERVIQLDIDQVQGFVYSPAITMADLMDMIDD